MEFNRNVAALLNTIDAHTDNTYCMYTKPSLKRLIKMTVSIQHGLLFLHSQFIQPASVWTETFGRPSEISEMTGIRSRYPTLSTLNSLSSHTLLRHKLVSWMTKSVKSHPIR